MSQFQFSYLPRFIAISFLFLLSVTAVTAEETMLKEDRFSLVEASFNTSSNLVENQISSIWNDLRIMREWEAKNNDYLANFKTLTVNNQSQEIYTELSALNDRGRLVTSTNRNLIGKSYLNDSLYQAALSGTHFEIRNEAGNNFFYFSINRGKFTVIAKVDSAIFERFLNLAKASPEASQNILFNLNDNAWGKKGASILDSNTKLMDSQKQSLIPLVEETINSGFAKNATGYINNLGQNVAAISGEIKFADDFSAGLVSELGIKFLQTEMKAPNAERIPSLTWIIASAIFAFVSLILLLKNSTLKSKINKASLALDHDDSDFRFVFKENDELYSLAGQVNQVLDLNEKLNEKNNNLSEQIKNLEEAVRDRASSLLEFEQVIQSMPRSIILVNENGIVTQANRESEKTIAKLFSVDKLVGSSVEIFKDHQEMNKLFSLNADQLPFVGQVNVDNETLDISVSALHDTQGEFKARALSWKLITEQLEHEEKERDIDHQLVKTIKTLEDSSTGLAHNSTGLAASISEMVGYTGEVENYMTSVATAAEELSSSISEIATSTGNATNLTSGAVNKMQSTNEIINSLKNRSDEIATILKVVTEIANQTNLLALNATIEAARAGEAGKGFAVVANEVKELAARTTEATEDISQKIDAIQSETSKALNAVEDAGHSMSNINEVTLTIASAVEEQSAVTNEIGHSVRTSSEKVAAMIDNVHNVEGLVSNNIERTAQLKVASDALVKLTN